MGSGMLTHYGVFESNHTALLEAVNGTVLIIVCEDQCIMGFIVYPIHGNFRTVVARLSAAEQDSVWVSQSKDSGPD